MVEHLLAVGANEEVEVVIAMPGDTVVLRAGDLHCVITVFTEGTPACEQLANVNGQTWISKWDVERCFWRVELKQILMRNSRSYTSKRQREGNDQR